MAAGSSRTKLLNFRSVTLTRQTTWFQAPRIAAIAITTTTTTQRQTTTTAAIAMTTMMLLLRQQRQKSGTVLMVIYRLVSVVILQLAEITLMLK